jgi:hypothetical protein
VHPAGDDVVELVTVQLVTLALDGFEVAQVLGEHQVVHAFQDLRRRFVNGRSLGR